MSIESGPFLTMLTLGSVGLSAFPWQSLVGAVSPLTLGVVIGNLDRAMKDLLARAVPLMIPYFGFAPGAGVDLGRVRGAGLLGILLGLTAVVITGSALVFADKLTGGTGAGGIAAAIVLAASGVVVTVTAVPLITARWFGHFGCITEDPADTRPKRSAVHKAA
jgi:2-keto-3-deoxygluconate permease